MCVFAGMVQICSECNDKHLNLADGLLERNALSTGRQSPSDSRSQANSDSSGVRFKVCLFDIEKYEHQR